MSMFTFIDTLLSYFEKEKARIHLVFAYQVSTLIHQICLETPSVRELFPRK